VKLVRWLGSVPATRGRRAAWPLWCRSVVSVNVCMLVMSFQSDCAACSHPLAARLGWPVVVLQVQLRHQTGVARVKRRVAAASPQHCQLGGRVPQHWYGPLSVVQGVLLYD
jgi:hypothetical protein